jgi:hypothetical protein
MEDWQLTLVILASVFVGALIPLLLMGAVALYRAGGAIADVGAKVKHTLARVDVISERVEVLTRGFKGGEADIADLLASVGHLARGLERNMKAINIVSAVLASVGTAIAAYVGARHPVDGAEQTHPPDLDGAVAKAPPPSPAVVSPEATISPQ